MALSRRNSICLGNIFLSTCTELNIFLTFSDKQQEVDINNLRLGEEEATRAAKGAAGRASKVQPPLSQISGVKKPLGHTNSFRHLILRTCVALSLPPSSSSPHPPPYIPAPSPHVRMSLHAALLKKDFKITLARKPIFRRSCNDC